MRNARSLSFFLSFFPRSLGWEVRSGLGFTMMVMVHHCNATSIDRRWIDRSSNANQRPTRSNPAFLRNPLRPPLLAGMQWRQQHSLSCRSVDRWEKSPDDHLLARKRKRPRRGEKERVRPAERPPRIIRFSLDCHPAIIGWIGSIWMASDAFRFWRPGRLEGACPASKS